MKVEHLFVYGTLLGDARTVHAKLLKRKAVLLGPAFLHGARLYDLGEYPGAIRSSRRGAIVEGEIFALNHADRDELLRSLDKYEEFDQNDPAGSLFVRKAESIQFGKGRLPAWTYWYNGPLDHAAPLGADRYAPARRSRRRGTRKAA